MKNNNKKGLYFIPESPIWLLDQKRKEEAEKVLNDIAVYNNIEIQPFTLKVMDSEEKKEYNVLNLFERKLLPTTSRLYVIWYLIYFASFSFMLTFAMYVKSTGESDSGACTFYYEDILYSGIADFIMILSGCLLLGNFKKKYYIFYLPNSTSFDVYFRIYRCIRKMLFAVIILFFSRDFSSGFYTMQKL